MRLNRKHYYLGLDLATIQTGWAIGVVEGTRLVRLMKGTISLDKHSPLPIRLGKLRSHIVYLARHYPLEKVLFKEKPLHDHNRTISAAMFKAHGVIEVELPSFRFVDINPIDVKKCMTNNGHASKQLVQNDVKKRLNLPNDFSFKNFDESDAVGILMTGLLSENIIDNIQLLDNQYSRSIVLTPPY
jgi:Holliday junction resolvasome RuvABC endonuclease subunit